MLSNNKVYAGDTPNKRTFSGLYVYKIIGSLNLSYALSMFGTRKCLNVRISDLVVLPDS